jgi:hypothetical protein
LLVHFNLLPAEAEVFRRGRGRIRHIDVAVSRQLDLGPIRPHGRTKLGN